MSNTAISRIRKEMSEIASTNNPSETGIYIIPDVDDLYHVDAIISGPPETPYEGGTFDLVIKFPSSYPFQPPDVRFKTKIWHPNISSVTGVICLDILKDKWAAALTLRTILISIRALLASPEPSDPQDAVVAKQMLNDKTMFEKTAAVWTFIHASGRKDPDPTYNNLVERMVEMGVNREKALRILSHTGWDIDKATESAFE